MVDQTEVGKWYWVKVEGEWVPAVRADNGFISVTNACSYFLGEATEVGEPIEVPMNLRYEPCPFCGGFNLQTHAYDNVIRCNTCGARGPETPSISSSDERWNNRA